MSLFLRIDINIAAIVLLGTIFFMAYKRLDRQDRLNMIFLKTSLIILLEIFLETMTCVINGRPDQWLIDVSVFLHMCLFITAPILTYFWYIFIHHWVVSDTVILQKKNFILLIPVAANFIITVLSPIYGFVFVINSTNLYQRGNLFFISAAITYSYLFYSFALIIKQKQKIPKEDFLPLFVFGILPLIGGLLQTIFYGVLLMWSSSAFSLIIVYNFLQQRMIHLDSLTGVWTRGSFDCYISRRVNLQTNEKIGVVFIDIDGLKHINDEFGHLEGDNAIKTSIKLIKNALRKTDIIARFGGDEFVVVLDCESRQALEQTIERIKTSFTKYNEKSNRNYELECSFGFDILNSNNKSIEQFLHHVDELMYCNKKQKKVRTATSLQ